MTKHYSRNSALPDAEMTRYVPLFYASPSETAYLTYLIVGQAGVWISRTANQMLRALGEWMVLANLLQARSVGMKLVLASRDIFKILKAVIRLNPVLMVDFQSARTRADEGKQHQRVPTSNLYNVVLGESRSQITPNSPTGPPNIGSLRRSPPALVASNSPEIGNGVKPFVAWDFAPLFRFKFLSGKFLSSHCRNLLDRFGVWSGSFAVQPACGPFVF